MAFDDKILAQIIVIDDEHNHTRHVGPTGRRYPSKASPSALHLTRAAEPYPPPVQAASIPPKARATAPVSHHQAYATAPNKLFTRSGTRPRHPPHLRAALPAGRCRCWTGVERGSICIESSLVGK